MCGIYGIWRTGNETVARSVIQNATTRLRHRGPDDEGYLLANWQTGQWISCAGVETIAALKLPPLPAQADALYNLALGHRRLSILDLTEAGHGPMAYLDGKLWITYNGEVYNYLELRAGLKSKGYVFNTNTDTEVILAAYAEWGPECLQHFNGMFAFALWDSRKGQLFCARDRLGIKPFHYYWDEQQLIFASEIKALLAHPAVSGCPNQAIVYDYLALGSVDHTAETFFADIHRLPAAHYLLLNFETRQLTTQRWWDIQVNTALNGQAGQPDASAQFKELLVDAVRLRLRSDVPVGTCLSGGLDSSSIVSIANHLLLKEQAVSREWVSNQQKTFSACFNDPALDERPYIQQIINHTGAESNRVFPQGQNGLWAELKQLIWHQEEPFGSTSIYSQWNVMRLARQRGVTVLLDGQGGDELLAGYHHYLGPYLAQTMRARGLWPVLAAARAAAAGTGRSPLFLLALGLYNNLPGQWQRRMLSLGNTRLRTNPTVSGSMLLPSFKRQFAERHLSRSKHQSFHNLARRLYQDIFMFSLPALLRYEDRNSMAFSLEARVPFLDYRLVEFCFSLPADCRIRQGWTKWILRQAMADFLPEQIRWRRSKLGFATPERQWLQQGAAQIAEFFTNGDLLSAPYLAPQTIQKLQNVSAAGILSIPGLWRLINLEMWLRVFHESR